MRHLELWVGYYVRWNPRMKPQVYALQYPVRGFIQAVVWITFVPYTVARKVICAYLKFPFFPVNSHGGIVEEALR